MRFRNEDSRSRIELPSPACGRGSGGEGNSSILNPVHRGRSLSYDRSACPLRVCSLQLSPKLSKGFTLLELIVVITIIVFMMGLFMNRMLFYQEQAEKTAMEQVVGAVQSALTLQYGEILTRGKPSDAAALAQDNPMNWLQKRPPNYSGEFYNPTPQAVVPGNWMFDLKTRDLIYVVRDGNYFKPGKDGRKWIRFHVVLNYTASRLPSLQNAPDELTGMVFEPVEPYSWF
jgi:prepilin-type N-terminal cleavage/methylation domain-containing protein